MDIKNESILYVTSIKQEFKMKVGKIRQNKDAQRNKNRNFANDRPTLNITKGILQTKRMILKRLLEERTI